MKTAFIAKEHARIARHIMGSRFNNVTFSEVQLWMDRGGGKHHRSFHGHDQEAERYVQEHWGDTGVEIFRIHLLADRMQDRLPQLIEQELNEIRRGQMQVPYFKESRDLPQPYCRRPANSSPMAADPYAKMEVLPEECGNCGSKNDLTLAGWVSCPVCDDCIKKRGLEVCTRCRSFFSASMRIQDPVNEGRFICPVCHDQKEQKGKT